MAGDWIKAEKCTPNKPEVMRLARLWGIHQDQAFGVVMRFWMWADDACVDGLVDGVASHEVDDMMRFPGFAQGLVAVRWLEVDDAKPCIRIPNFSKHNSESAKKRALKNDRQSRWRFNNVVDLVDARTSTREEKRREDIKPKPMSRSHTNEDAVQLLTFLNDKTGRHYRPSRKTLEPINARLKDGFSLRECRAVIARKCREWSGDDKMAQYLRPITLFGATNFAQYVGEVPPEPINGALS